MSHFFLYQIILYTSLSHLFRMSNWGLRYLSDEQIAYAARDAWVAAAIIERLQQGNADVFGADSLIEMDFMRNQTPSLHFLANVPSTWVIILLFIPNYTLHFSIASFQNVKLGVEVSFR